MNLSSWPEWLLWQHYVHAQVGAASLGLIGEELLAIAVQIGEGSVTLHVVVSQRTDEVLEDIDDICFDLDVLLDGHTKITAEVSVGFDADSAWRHRHGPDGLQALGIHAVYIAKGAVISNG